MIWPWSLLLCALVASLIHVFFITRMLRVTQRKRQSNCESLIKSEELTRISAAPTHPSPQDIPGVSVIVCAKNEADRLIKLIPEILNQRYPNFELILVNDHSSDQTQVVIDEWAKKDPRVRCFTPSKKAKTLGKKAALSFGISQASHDLLLLTDADCLPASAHWIDLMTAPLRANKSVALGFGGYLKRPGFLNSVIRFETTLTAGLFLGQAIAGQPYMGVGRNLAYRKDFFNAQGGFRSHEHIVSGDDDLLINHGANKKNTAAVLDPMAYTWSLPQTSWRGLFRQKRRHQSAAHFYRTSTKMRLGLYSGSILLFYLSLLLIGLLQPFNAYFCLAVMALVVGRSIYLIWQMRSIFDRFQTADLNLQIPILEPVLICLQLIIFVWNRFSKPDHWN